MTGECSKRSIVERVRHQSGVFYNCDRGTITDGHAGSFLSAMLQRVQT